MLHFIAENLAPIMFLALIGFMILGYPVAFALAANGLVFFVIAVELAPYAPDVISLSWPLLWALPERVFAVMSNEVLLAVPFFTFMGLVLERSGMAEDLLDTIGQLFGSVPGGVAYAVIFVGTLLAATTGVVAASVISMGLISLPVMMRYGYDRGLSAGTIMGSGVLAQIIPPSTVLIVLADQLGTSVGSMFAVAFLPGLLLVLSFATFIFVVTLLRPGLMPGLPPEAIGFREPDGSRGVWQVVFVLAVSALAMIGVIRLIGVSAVSDFTVLAICLTSTTALAGSLLNRWAGLVGSAAVTAAAAAIWVLLRPETAWQVIALATIVTGGGLATLSRMSAALTGRPLISTMAERVTFVLVPPILLIFLVLGTIFLGIATPVEGGAMGALGAVLLAGVKRVMDRNPARFSLPLLRQAVEQAAKLSAFIVFILIGARVFALTFYGINGHVWVEHLLAGLPGGEVGFLVFVLVLVFILGCFLDFFEIAFIVIPLLIPAAHAVGVDLLLLGLLIAMVLQMSFLTPPLGFALFFLRSVAPDKLFRDKVTGRMTEGVTTRQIYLGAVPFICLQLVMSTAIVIWGDFFTASGKNVPVLNATEAQNVLETLDIGVPDVMLPKF